MTRGFHLPALGESDQDASGNEAERHGLKSHLATGGNAITYGLASLSAPIILPGPRPLLRTVFVQGHYSGILRYRRPPARRSLLSETVGEDSGFCVGKLRVACDRQHVSTQPPTEGS